MTMPATSDDISVYSHANPAVKNTLSTNGKRTLTFSHLAMWMYTRSEKTHIGKDAD